MLDVLIRGGWIADGTGNPVYPADLAIEDDSIVDIGRLDQAKAKTTIDAAGKIVAPGFVDINSHTDWSIFSNPNVESTVRQGVTTELVGNCGNGFAPVTAHSREFVTARLREFAYGGPVDWSDYAEYLEAISTLRTSNNLAFMVGHNTLRYAVGLFQEIPTREQMQAMEAFLREAMECGAMGLSSGLEFQPGRLAQIDELIRLNRIVGEYDGWYASHIRNRDAFLQEAVDEFIQIVRDGGTRGELLHLNVRYNTGAAPGAWERAVGSLEGARRLGLEVLTDTTPYPYGTGMMAGILPPWLFERGVQGALEGLREESVREQLRGQCDRYWRFIHRGDWDRIWLQGSAQFPELSGRTFAEISEIMRKDPWECYFDILAAAGTKLESLQLIGTLFTEGHLAEMIRHPLFSLSADTFSSRIDGPLADVIQHPLPFAGHVHFLTHHARSKHTLTMEDAIRKLSSMPATQYRLRRRGMLRPGNFADVVVFDYEALDDVSTLQSPLHYVRGVEHVFVNGIQVVKSEQHTGAQPGRILRRTD